MPHPGSVLPGPRDRPLGGLVGLPREKGKAARETQHKLGVHECHVGKEERDMVLLVEARGPTELVVW